MPIFEEFARASFNKIPFPYDGIEIKGSSRHHIHEFPHSAGGDPEKMGRKLYTIRFRCPFHALPGSDLERNFPELYPNRLRNLLALFDKEYTGDLVVPNLGTIKAFCVDWTGRADLSDSLSGERWELEFLEDQERASIITEIPSYGRVQATNEQLQKLVVDAPDGFSIWQRINDAITSVDGLIGLADVYSNLIASKLEAVAELCARADRELESLQDPSNHIILSALKDVWASAQDLAENVEGVGASIQTYRVPKRMAITQVATTLYGDAEKSFDLLQMNAIADAFDIPAGTEIRYFKDAA